MIRNHHVRVEGHANDPPYTADGAGRDRPENYLINMPADTLAALPRYDFEDGAGQVHVKIGAIWSLIGALEQASGQPVEYLNLGRGGSASANTQHNALRPARLHHALDSGADVLLLHFGMNELGQSTTLVNHKSIVSQARAVGMDVIVMSVPRRNVVDGPWLTGWNYTNRVLWRSAVEAGAAFAPQHWIVTDEQLGGMGASPESPGAAALFNRAGPAEFSRYGQVLVRSVLG
ncbi:SGNH/GDSL hydrolase family protein [Stenotrophomonas sp. C4297]|uniref:SGNH/GDSL hydrolase family protein n=1 Tax=Stenotrophomonas sp. C4297 TaxID=3077847 RepID=UPI00293C98E7|nr:SGNH/GDSL hydrolase family protein [Stenotrophomonas sp. C4297]MDV3510094.1 SGNH/GDSL hydrolase family protein [Stenotrophomonas sp. C4297]